MSGKKGMKDYPLATKLEAVRLYQEEGKSQKAIREGFVSTARRSYA